MSPEDSIDWTRAGVPAYLQSNVDFNICGEESQALTLGRAGEMMWKQIRCVALGAGPDAPAVSWERARGGRARCFVQLRTAPSAGVVDTCANTMTRDHSSTSMHCWCTLPSRFLA